MIWQSWVAIIVVVSGAGASAKPITVMPLGDSITEGYGNPGGYRINLFSSLGGSSKVDFVGSQNNGPLTDKNHEGHDGYTIDLISANLNGYAAPAASMGVPNSSSGGYWISGGGIRPAIAPDFVLLMAGTNDIYYNTNVSTMASRLDSLIGKIVSLLPRAKIIVSSILPLNGSKFGNANANNQVIAYNSQIKNTIVPKYRQTSLNVSFIDSYAAFTNANGSPNFTNIAADGIHPTATGYNLIAAKWYSGIHGAIALPDGIYPTSGGDQLITTTWAGGVRAAIPEPTSLSAIGFAIFLSIWRKR